MSSSFSYLLVDGSGCIWTWQTRSTQRISGIGSPKDQQNPISGIYKKQGTSPRQFGFKKGKSEIGKSEIGKSRNDRKKYINRE
jgi:hypothetical protein